MTQMHVLRLVAPRIENESHTKDIDFSALGVSGCCEAGYAATWNASERAPWRGKFDPIEGVIYSRGSGGASERGESAAARSVLVDWARLTTHATFAWTLQ
jgi:NTE family protein